MREKIRTSRTFATAHQSVTSTDLSPLGVWAMLAGNRAMERLAASRFSMDRPDSASEREAAIVALNDPAPGRNEDTGASIVPGLSGPDDAAAVDALGGGSPLSDTVRVDMEARLGRDFRGVRVHDDATAALSANAFHAVAFTVGRHVAFARGRYDPATETGRRLLTHELVHVDQGRRSGDDSGVVHRQPDGGTSSGGFAGNSGVRWDDSGTAVVLTAEQFQALTGASADELPEGVMVFVEDTAEGGQAVESTGIQGQDYWPYAFGSSMARMQLPSYPIPANSVGVMWGSGHLSQFANVAGEMTAGGFRSTLWRHTLADFIGGPFNRVMTTGVPGNYYDDRFFTLYPARQTIAYRPVDAFTARSVGEMIEQRVGTMERAYRYPPPEPGTPLFERIFGGDRQRVMVCGAQNCITEVAPEVTRVLGTRLYNPRTEGALDVHTGRLPDGTIDPFLAGRGSQVRGALTPENPVLSGNGVTVREVPRTTLAARGGIAFLRKGGVILMVTVGIPSTMDRLSDAWGTEQFPRVAGEEAGGWTGGILGSALGGAAGAALVCAPGGPIDLLCVAGGFLGGLLGGEVFSRVGSTIGGAVTEAAASIPQRAFDWYIDRLMENPDPVAHQDASALRQVMYNDDPWSLMYLMNRMSGGSMSGMGFPW